ncbi:hypothetical protein JYU34_010880 [Plutella xylostella]|uniref:Secreted protein n=1 Tax=Plutella xylostella TaxID=51655 RepID=A0ABQ7QGT3_PLUXY|nr:hypothetical protein JYU34_010880 [Plutella xylostella]
MRTVVRAWPVRVVVAVGWAMLSGGASEARAGHGGLLLALRCGRPRRALHGTEPRRRRRRSAARAGPHRTWLTPPPRSPPPARARCSTGTGCCPLHAAIDCEHVAAGCTCTRAGPRRLHRDLLTTVHAPDLGESC